MTSAVTGMSIAPTPALANTAAPANAAASMEAPADAKSGVSPAAQASVPDPPGSSASKPAQLGLQVSSVLLGLTVGDKASSATAPDTGPPPTAAPVTLAITSTAYTEFGVNAAAASQSADNEGSGDSSGDAADFKQLPNRCGLDRRSRRVQRFRFGHKTRVQRPSC